MVKSGTWRKWSFRVLVCVFVLSFIASTIVLWANVRIQDSDQWAQTVAPLADDPAIQAFIVDQSATLIESQLQTQVDSGGIRGRAISQTMPLVRPALEEFVTTPTFASFWTDANYAAHQSLQEVARADSDAVMSTTKDELVLNLEPVLDWTNTRLAETLPVDLTISSENPEVVLYSGGAIDTIMRWIERIDTLAVVLPIVAIVSLAGALILAGDRRRAVGQIALGTAIGAILVLGTIAIGKNIVVSGQPGENQNAIAALLHIVLIDLVRAYRIIAGVTLGLAGVLYVMHWRRGASLRA